MRSRYRLVLSFFSILMFPFTLTAYSSGPLPQLTGGFNEQTCVRCHTGFSLNEGRLRGGDLHLAGVPKTFSAGETYFITVMIAHPGQSRWGFELSARHASTGVQAGQIVPADDMTQVKEAGGIQYVEHTSAGTRKGVADGPVEFRFKWIAPDPKDGPVFFNAAGNAANSSGDPAGDYIYTAGAYSGVESLTAQPVSTPKEARKPLERLNTATRLLHLPSPKGLPKGSLIFTVQHRFFGEIGGPEPPLRARPGNAFGLDTGAIRAVVVGGVDELIVDGERSEMPTVGRALLALVVWKRMVDRPAARTAGCPWRCTRPSGSGPPPWLPRRRAG